MGSIKTFADLFRGEMIAVLIAVSVINGLLLFWASLKFLLVFQQSGYRHKRYFKWLKNPETPYLSRLMLLCLMALLFFCVLNATFGPIVRNDDIAPFIGFASYLLFTFSYIKTEKNVNVKVPLKKTKRLVRLSITYVFLLSLFTFGFILLINGLGLLIEYKPVVLFRYALICGMPILSPYILFLANAINSPLETLIKRYYLNLAKNKIKKHDVIKIGITGSYGKTSVKEILKTLLSQKFRVLSSPESFNTPLGLALTVKDLDSTHDILIAEMGARHVGDIFELCELVNPQYGILTGLNTQHLESFGSTEKIKQTKNELFEYIGANGVGFFSTENDALKELYEKFDGEKYSVSLDDENCSVTASDITYDNRGTTFTLKIQGEEPIQCSTVLLGKHSVKNICLASAVAKRLGLTSSEIALGINRITSVGHRLELLPNNKNIVTIDDSYNCNEDGILAAMEVLDTFSGRKIVVTPGLVELGKRENIANFEFGKLLASQVDIVIIVGKHNAEMLINGLVEGGMDKSNIMFEKNSTRGNQTLNTILKEGDVVLFENDLPDNYN